MIGSELGQFHSDFPAIHNHKEVPWAVESYFLGKKMYIDKITDSTGDIDYMIRCKGISQDSIKHAYTNNFNNDPMRLYKYIYDGHTYTFDLTNGKACFEMKNDMTVITKEHFTRRIKTTYDDGSIDHYFGNNSEHSTESQLKASLNFIGDNSADESALDDHDLALDDVFKDMINAHAVNTLPSVPLSELFEDKFIVTYNYLKFGKTIGHSVYDTFAAHQTGMALKTNLVDNFAVIDIDINKALDDHQRAEIRKQIIDKLTSDDIIVESGSGGLHIYCVHDIFTADKNRYIACYKCDDYSIDYLTSVDQSKQSIVMLPRSFNERGEYTFIQGSYESTLKRTSTQILESLNLRLDIKPTIKPSIRLSEEYRHSCQASSAYQQLLVDGLTFNTAIHATARKIDQELSIYTLFQAINILDDKYRDAAYDRIRTSPYLTGKASIRFDDVAIACADKAYPLPVLLKIIKIYNAEYYETILTRVQKK